MTVGTILLRLLPPKLTIRMLVHKELASGEPELQRILTMPGKGLFVDVGANRGLYSYVAHLAGFRVLAFEPNPRLAEYIRKWSTRNIEVCEELVSSHSGTARIAIPLGNRGNELDGLASADVERIELHSENVRQLEVQAIAIDSLSLTDVGFIKIDVEGHEFEVLKGSRETLIANQPILQVEVEERHRSGNIKRCHDFLAALGYRCYYVRQNKVFELSAFSLEEDQTPSNLGNRELYINNFYFVATDAQLSLLNSLVVNER